MIRISKKGKIVVYIALGIALLLTWIPLLWIFLTSIRSRGETLAYPPVWFFKPTLSSFSYLASSTDFLTSYFNSIYVGGISTIIVIGLAIPAAYALARLKFAGKDNVGFYIISTKMTPPIVVLYAFYIMFSNLGLLRTLSGLIILHIAINLPLAVWLLKGFFESLPQVIEEAAKIDGCSDWSVMWKITFPLSLPGIMVTGVLCLMFSWMEFIFASTITDPTTRTVPVLIYSWISYSQIYWERVAAAGILYIIPVFVLSIAIRKNLLRGMSFGLLK
ncbi:carbohydrate ABC transporter permease [Atribacter laminatus]|uniref:Maltose/maltodextrin transport system permease protein MalG n=1 Tax=Atribacter laminatus TaxID=2847778 RepID=A0A7T1ALM0_ATRLM|nr:carbohydrate ABC transporter permease [Atribacter laminatus]QPM68164.1 Inner membrane ABC transporter permease protein YcjP [Atribacter laminatus]